ncbi:hypothetical protein F5X97DRAFT_341942 [Nemania serpens]|nr:hypothetical protein F5X97DRAFT_341942 [Nemania serpens]
MVGSSGTDTTLSSADRRSEIPPSSQEHGSVASGLSTEPTSRPVSHPAATSKPGQTQTLWILIFKGRPRDLQSTRITELYIAFEDDEGTNITIRLQGAYPDFRIQEEWNQPLPWMRPNFHRRLAVSTWKDLGMRVRDAIWTTPVNNTELDYGCQSWVGDVVTVLQDANLITAEEGDNALNGMNPHNPRPQRETVTVSGPGRGRDVNEMVYRDGSNKLLIQHTGDGITKDRNMKDGNTKDRNTKDRNMKDGNSKDGNSKGGNREDGMKASLRS